MNYHNDFKITESNIKKYIKNNDEDLKITTSNLFYIEDSDDEINENNSEESKNKNIDEMNKITNEQALKNILDSLDVFDPDIKLQKIEIPRKFINRN